MNSLHVWCALELGNAINQGRPRFFKQLLAIFASVSTWFTCELLYAFEGGRGDIDIAGR